MGESTAVKLTSLHNLQQYSDALLEAYQLPAISIAVWQGGELHRAASGILNLATGVEATSDSIFQIGSITKVMTTCLVMQLVDEGRVDLDKPVRHYLRDFQVADADASGNITVRQLLNHTSGMAGDFFSQEEGHRGDLIARFVDRCNLLPQVNAPGAMYSYSNTAFVIAGHLVEVMRGISWYQAMSDYIYKPLGMQHATADPKDTIRFRAAMGHLPEGDAWKLSDQPWLSLGMAPCGSAAMMSASDLILFARAHLNGGKNQQGEKWLSPSSVHAMQQPEVALPKLSSSIDGHFGLGWDLKTLGEDGLKTYGHNGTTRGYKASLRVFPEQDAAYSILVNGLAPKASEDIQATLQEALTGIAIKDVEIDKGLILNDMHRAIAGHYESFDKCIDITTENDRIVAELMYKIDHLPSEHFRLFPIMDGCYGAETFEGVRRANLAFTEIDPVSGKPGYCFDGSRLNPRVG